MHSVAYIGREKNVHDKLFVSILEREFKVVQIYTSNLLQLRFDEKFFENCSLIIAGPLTDAISAIPESNSLPILGVSHAFDINLESQNPNLKTNINRCYNIITDCDYVKKILRENYNFRRDVYLVPFGCDHEYFEKVIPDYKSEPYILVTRNWFQVHSNEVVIAALELLLSSETRFDCTFIGDGPLLTQQVREISLRSGFSSINFLGTKSKVEIRNEMTKNWLYVSAADSDGTSISLLEAMSAGMICIVTDFPSNLEWIQHGYNGFIFERKDSASLSVLIQEICSIPLAEKRIIGERAKLVAKSRGDWLINKEILMDACQRVISLRSEK
jgi:glycosyltransferase involved in cell wall biosynthesis